MEKIIPIVLFTFNRYDHTKKVLEALKINKIDLLIVYIDGPRNDQDYKESNKIHNYVNSIEWCQTIVNRSENNKGLARSIKSGLNEVFLEYSEAIILEDDCVPTEDFYEYMKYNLEKYRNTKKIMCINGYKYPYKLPSNYKYSTYITEIATSWGWATWKDRWQSFNDSHEYYGRLIRNKKFVKRVNNINEGLIPMLKFQFIGIVNSWAIFWTLNIIENNSYCIAPTNSKIVNIGMDGSGTHSRYNKKFALIEEKDNYLELDNLGINKEIQIRERDFFKQTSFQKIKNFIFQYKIMKKLYKLIKKMF